jgi:hypothetical protein
LASEFVGVLGNFFSSFSRANAGIQQTVPGSPVNCPRISPRISQPPGCNLTSPRRPVACPPRAPPGASLSPWLSAWRRPAPLRGAGWRPLTPHPSKMKGALWRPSRIATLPFGIWAVRPSGGLKPPHGIPCRPHPSPRRPTAHRNRLIPIKAEGKFYLLSRITFHTHRPPFPGHFAQSHFVCFKVVFVAARRSTQARQC